MKDQQQRINPYKIAFYILAIVILTLSGLLVLNHGSLIYPPPISVVPANITPAITPKPLLSQQDIDTEVSKLIGTSPDYPTRFEQAMRVRANINKGEFPAANTIISDFLHQGLKNNWRFQPTKYFFDLITEDSNEKYLESLNNWVKKQPNNAIPYLLRTKYHYNTGWDIRGNGYANKVPDQRMNQFIQHLELAMQDLNKAMQLDDNPYYAKLLIDILGAFGDDDSQATAFQKILAKYPQHLGLFQARLNNLPPKWGGSVEQMYAFVDKYAKPAPIDSPLKILYLNLYTGLLDVASSHCYAKKAKPVEDCVQSSIAELATAELQQNVQDALQMQHYADHYQFILSVYDALDQITHCRCYEKTNGTLLQWAANGIGNNNELLAPEPAKNNFMLDSLIAKIWVNKQHYGEAEKLYQRAIANVPNFQFSSQELKDLSMANLYDDLAFLYADMQQYQKTIIYQKAAERLDGIYRPNRSYLQCLAYYNLKQFDNALQACSQQIDIGDDVNSRYLRGRSYQDMGNLQLAIDDFHAVAEQSRTDGYQNDAAIKIGHIYTVNGDFQKSLDTLNHYTYLFDDDLQNDHVLAISYNNRCYAYMKLDKLNEALADCNKSLTYEQLPDALQKQHDIQQRLNGK
ncbi:DUF4034 domain-containing protein [Methylomonas sp. AM2-LC]|uniref:DUF4034 domain-containing protein n=1 Tax=Methylomonas sp. AM2-LC TaxID=3153301 RepID=UPI003262F8C9